MEIRNLFNIFSSEPPPQDTSGDYIKYTVGFVCVCASLLFVAYKFFQHRPSESTVPPLNGKAAPGSPVTQRITATTAFEPKLLSECTTGNLKGVKECIEKHGVSTNCLGDKSTLLIEVCKYCTPERESEYLEVAKYLISKGVEVNRIDGTGNTALLYAVKNGFNELTKLLIAHSADVNYVRKFDDNQIIETPLFLAVSNGHSKVMETLLSTDAALFDETTKNKSFLHIAAEKGNPVSVAILIDQGFSPDAKDSNHQTPLHIAAKKGFPLVIQTLLGKNASINAQTNDQETPLFCAAKEGQTEAARCLMQNGANVDMGTITDMTPLHIAAMNGHVDVLKVILEVTLELKKEINLNITNRVGQTPLHCASLAGKSEVVKFLIESGASKDVKDKAIPGRTPKELAKNDATKDAFDTKKIKWDKALIGFKKKNA